MASHYRIAYFIPDKIYIVLVTLHVITTKRVHSFHSSSVDVSGIIVDYFVVLTVSCVLKCYAKVQLYRFSSTHSLCQNMLMNYDTNHDLFHNVPFSNDKNFKGSHFVGASQIELHTDWSHYSYVCHHFLSHNILYMQQCKYNI